MLMCPLSTHTQLCLYSTDLYMNFDVFDITDEEINGGYITTEILMSL